MPSDPPVTFCTDAALGYQRSRTRFVPGSGLSLDESYRLAHLPLIAPGHPDVIPVQEGKFYSNGRHPRVASLALPLPHDILFASPAFRALDAELNAAPFAPKLAWRLIETRREKLHATVCGALSVGDPAFVAGAELKGALARIAPFRVRLVGLFSGNVNLGRLYLRVYPQMRDGGNVIHQVQRALGRPPTDLYVAGLHNFIDHLDADEAAALERLIVRWWDRQIVELTVEHLWILHACDDLVLDGGIAEVIPLGSS